MKRIIFDVIERQPLIIWDFIKRITSFLEDIREKEGIFLAVAHGGTNEVIFNLVQNLEKDNFRRYHQDNACINEINYKEGKWVILSINDISHLKSVTKPKRDIYANQGKLKEEILKEVIKILGETNILSAHLFGSLANEKFAKYSEKYGRHEGSNINVLARINKQDIPIKWKYIGKEEGLWEIYEIGKYKMDDIKHKIDLFIVKQEDEERIKEEITNSGSKIEEII